MVPDSNANAGTFSWKLLLLLFAAALVIRIPFLGRADLWCDEILFVQLSAPPQDPFQTWGRLWGSFQQIGHFPLPCVIENIFLWIVRPFAGTDLSAAGYAFWSRIPAAVFGAACVPFVALLGAMVGGRAVGIASAMLYATFHYPVFYAREAYFYAPLVFFCLAGLYFFFRLCFDRGTRISPRLLLLTATFFAAASLSHVTGILLPLICLLIGVVRLFVRESGRTKNQIGLCLLAALLGAIPAMPLFFQRFSEGGKMSFQTPYPLSTILADGIGKQFFGTGALALAAACALLLAGAVACFVTRDARRPLRIALLVVAVFVCAGVVAGSRSSLYYSRYFNAATGLLYILFALGLTLIPFRLKLPMPVLGAIIAALVHAVLFLPSTYALPAKGVNYGGISRALVQNFPPGTPYVMESGYEMRFTPGFFKTPGLLAACPYLHGDVTELWSRQKRFFERFPEAVYVESARHGSSPLETTGIFEWPRKHFRQKIEVANEPLARLAARGIWPQAVDPSTEQIQSRTTLYYNTPADNEAIARASGTNAIALFPGWKTMEIAQHQYARVASAETANILINNLSPEYLVAELEMPIGLAAPPGTPYKIELLQDGGPVGSALPHVGGQFNTMQTGSLRFKPGTTTITIRITEGHLPSLQGIIVPGCIIRPL